MYETSNSRLSRYTSRHCASYDTAAAATATNPTATPANRSHVPARSPARPNDLGGVAIAPRASRGRNTLDGSVARSGRPSGARKQPLHELQVGHAATGQCDVLEPLP